MPSPYQSEFFQALMDLGVVEFEVFFNEHLPSDRAALGWHTEKSGYRSTYLGRSKVLRAISIAWNRRSSIHVVNSIWGVPAFLPVLLIQCAFGCRPFFVLSESSNPQIARSGLRVILRNSLGKIIARCKRARVLAIAPLAEKQYAALGFSRDRIHAFAYFRSSPPNAKTQVASFGKRIIFVGQFVHRKGWDLLVEALETLWIEDQNIALTFVGSGINEPHIAAVALLNSRISIKRAVNSDRISSIIGEHDVLVLPSRFDGWGIVVNEAMAMGVPSIVSSQCGVACLIKSGYNGFVFESENVADLRSKLRDFIQMRPLSRKALRDACFREAGRVSAASAARYFMRCIHFAEGHESKFPRAPWDRRKLQDPIGARSSQYEGIIIS